MLLGRLQRRGGRAALWLVVGLLIGGTVGAAATYLIKRGKAGIPGGPRLGPAEEMVYVPPDAAGFIHIRLRDVWHTEGFAEFRKVIEKAGPQARAALDESFVPAPSSLDRMTLVFLKSPTRVAPGAAPPMVPKEVNAPRKNAAQPKKGGLQPPPPPPPPPLGPPMLPPPPPRRGGFADDLIPGLDGDLKVVIVLAFNAPFDAGKVRDAYLKEGTKQSIAGREYWDDTTSSVAAYFPSDTVMVLGDSAGMKLYLTRLATTTGPLESAIKHAAEGSRHVVAALNVGALGINAKMFEGAPEEFQSLAKNAQTVLKAESLLIGLALAEETRIDIRLKYKDDAGAVESEAALRELAKVGREKLAEPKKEMEAALNGKPGAPKPRPIRELPEAVGGLFGLGAINTLDEWLADPPLETKGNEVVFTPKVPSISSAYMSVSAMSVGLLLPAVQKTREAAARMSSSNNLKQIGLAVHNYAAANQDNLPMPSWTQGDGRPKPGGLSWRVHLLPYVEEDNLYKQFHLDEPWDSTHNIKLADRVPRVYTSPNAPPVPGKTYYKMCTGPAALFNSPVKYKIFNIPDGTANTIMVVEGGAPVTWTKPDDFVIDANKPLPDMKLNGNSRVNVLLGDGSVRSIDLATIKEKTLRNAICPDDGEVLGNDW